MTAELRANTDRHFDTCDATRQPLETGQSNDGLFRRPRAHTLVVTSFMLEL